MLTSHPQHQKS